MAEDNTSVQDIGARLDSLTLAIQQTTMSNDSEAQAIRVTKWQAWATIGGLFLALIGLFGKDMFLGTYDNIRDLQNQVKINSSDITKNHTFTDKNISEIKLMVNKIFDSLESGLDITDNLSLANKAAIRELKGYIEENKKDIKEIRVVVSDNEANIRVVLERTSNRYKGGELGD